MIYLIVVLLLILAFTTMLSFYLYHELLDERHHFYDYAEWIDPVNLVNGDEND